MTSADTPLTVHQALAAVMVELPNIGKSDKSPEGYAYRGIEAVTKHLQPLLAKHGVVIVPDAHVLATVPSPAMKDGWQDVMMHVDWTIYGPDGSSVKASTNGVGRDRSDKGANKAQTQAFKYLVLHLFCIADGKDDSDGQTYEHDRTEPVDPDRAVATQAHVNTFDAVKAELSGSSLEALSRFIVEHELVAPTKKGSIAHAERIIAEATRLRDQQPTKAPEPEPA